MAQVSSLSLVKRIALDINKFLDLHEYQGGPIYIPSKTPHPLTQETTPITIGHEFSGTITAIGAGVEGAKWSEGLKVGSVCAFDNSVLLSRGGISNHLLYITRERIS